MYLFCMFYDYKAAVAVQVAPISVCGKHVGIFRDHAESDGFNLRSVLDIFIMQMVLTLWCCCY